MESIVVSAILTAGGMYFLVRNIGMLRDQGKMIAYVQTSPKAKIWVSKYGLERTIELTKKYFLPLGIVVSMFMLGIGAWSLLAQI